MQSPCLGRVKVEAGAPGLSARLRAARTATRANRIMLVWQRGSRARLCPDRRARGLPISAFATSNARGRHRCQPGPRPIRARRRPSPPMIYADGPGRGPARSGEDRGGLLLQQVGCGMSDLLPLASWRESAGLGVVEAIPASCAPSSCAKGHASRHRSVGSSSAAHRNRGLRQGRMPVVMA